MGVNPARHPVLSRPPVPRCARNLIGSSILVQRHERSNHTYPFTRQNSHEVEQDGIQIRRSPKVFKNCGMIRAANFPRESDSKWRNSELV